MRISQTPWIVDHVIDGKAVYPPAGMMAMAIEAIRQLCTDRSPSGCNLRDITFSYRTQGKDVAATS
ncbi:hypothetical protein K469DRAFT_374198 [Zopfia rhizophila CBS 207.26]|uniref:PKS/mFAS DH domain-containing protein n=1 Tax=Zopfia rhizophila CBS 207.26 TaxID=1314779 RepID=A0A6A6EHP5_9PEZI|nr:hypothetical protein K469DRAFT_374198 [Zopfia rhizophila CBS 207.26]